MEEPSRGERRSGRPSQTVECEAHGLRYDSALYSGCVLCRRSYAPALGPQWPAWWIPAALAGVALLSVAAFEIGQRVADRLHPPAVVDAPAREPSQPPASHGPTPRAEEGAAASAEAAANAEEETAQAATAQAEEEAPAAIVEGASAEAQAPEVERLAVADLARRVEASRGRAAALVVFAYGAATSRELLPQLVELLARAGEQADFHIFTLDAGLPDTSSATAEFAEHFDQVRCELPAEDARYLQTQLDHLGVTADASAAALPVLAALDANGRAAFAANGNAAFAEFASALEGSIVRASQAQSEYINVDVVEN